MRTLDVAEVDTVVNYLGLARLLQGDGHYLVAWIGKRPVAHAYLALSEPPHLQDLEVDPEFRRRGIARELVSAVEAEAVLRGFDTLQLEVSADDAHVQALYRSLGFRDTGRDAIVVQGTIQIRTGPIEVDDRLLTWEKRLTDAK